MAEAVSSCECASCARDKDLRQIPSRLKSTGVESSGLHLDTLSVTVVARLRATSGPAQSWVGKPGCSAFIPRQTTCSSRSSLPAGKTRSGPARSRERSWAWSPLGIGSSRRTSKARCQDHPDRRRDPPRPEARGTHRTGRCDPGAGGEHLALDEEVRQRGDPRQWCRRVGTSCPRHAWPSRGRLDLSDSA